MNVDKQKNEIDAKSSNDGAWILEAIVIVIGLAAAAMAIWMMIEGWTSD